MLALLYWSGCRDLTECLTSTSWISRKRRCCRGKQSHRMAGRPLLAVIPPRLWILTGGKVKNYHQISHWFQLALPATKQPLSVCDRWLVLILRLVPLRLIATGSLSVVEPDQLIVYCMKPWNWSHIIRLHEADEATPCVLSHVLQSATTDEKHIAG